jgi:mRNA interferase YafQ
MRRIERATAFNRDYRRAKAQSRYRNLDHRLAILLEFLVNDQAMPAQNRDHALLGAWAGYRDCHLWPDLMLIYAKPSPHMLRLVRLGSHSELFESPRCRDMPADDADEVSIGVTAFKARCLTLIDDVARGKTRRVALMKHNRPVAAIVPVEGCPAPLWGALRGTVTVAPGADLTQEAGEVWEADT